MNIRQAACQTALLLASSVASAEEPSLVAVRDDLYRFTAGPYHGMVWANEHGIVVIDPINTAAATWLKGELAKRFTAPVRHVIYSHNHFDHVYGGEVFDGPGVTFIAHEAARDDLVRSKARTRIPDLTFKDELSIHLGDDVLELRYHGPNNGRGSVSMLFPKQRTMFVVDWILVGRMPFKTLQGYDIEGMIRSTREVLALDWDLFIGGHADMGDKAAVARYLAYLEALYGAVRDGMIGGQSLAELQRSIRLDDFRDFRNYDAWLPLNIAGVYRTLEDASYLLDRPEATTQPFNREPVPPTP